MELLLSHCSSASPLASSGQAGFDLSHADVGLNQFAMKQIAITEFLVGGYSETNFGFSDCIRHLLYGCMCSQAGLLLITRVGLEGAGKKTIGKFLHGEQVSIFHCRVIH